MKVNTITITIVPRIAAREFFVMADKNIDKAAMVLMLKIPYK